MFAADAQFDIRSGRPPALCSKLNQLPDAFDIQRNKWIAREDALANIFAQKLARIVA